MRYLSNGHEDIVHSPDIFMGNKKGTKYEHAIYMACLMMFMFTKTRKLPGEEDELPEEEKRNYQKSLILYFKKLSCGQNKKR